MEKPRVLVVDDNEATCTLITALLRNEFAVDIASEGNEALEKLKSRQYAAILLDLLMPVVDGYGILEFLKQERPDLLPRVLVVTAALSPRDMQRLRGYDVCTIIRKPFEVDEFQSAVRRCAGIGSDPFLRGPLLSGGMILLLADWIVRRG